MATVRDFVGIALREIGAFAAGETLPYVDANDGLLALNRLVDQWAAERLSIYTTTRTTWTITANTGTYAVAAGSTINRVRPVFIERINYVDTTGEDTEFPMTELSDMAYAAIAQKALTAVTPSYWWYSVIASPANVLIWPVPTGTTLQGVMYAPTAVPAFASLDTTVALPPGYERMIAKNLAVELAPGYGRKVDPALLKQAMMSVEIVKRVNRRTRDLKIDAGALLTGGGAWDISIGP